ncbi:effector-associated domain EAD1-containing protein [Pseudofrankia sp. BMG5.37]|nr:effector-associated domain EAD1-containing protein [Pseudofrankia sp. BMG5.37]MDT3443890.1 effector-associated domain EAD1-containing protein [Pseudofrankia sp. BMG5.37]
MPGDEVTAGLSDEQMTALAERFADPRSARQLLTEVGIPLGELPWNPEHRSRAALDRTLVAPAHPVQCLVVTFEGPESPAVRLSGTLGIRSGG